MILPNKTIFLILLTLILYVKAMDFVCDNYYDQSLQSQMLTFRFTDDMSRIIDQIIMSNDF